MSRRTKASDDIIVVTLEDDYSYVYMHMIYDTTKIGIDTILQLAENAARQSHRRNLVDDPLFRLEGLLVHIGSTGISLHPVLTVSHPFFIQPVFLVAAEDDGDVHYYDVEIHHNEAIVHWDPLDQTKDQMYGVETVHESDESEPTLSELLQQERMWWYVADPDPALMPQDQEEQIEEVLDGLGIRPESFLEPDREVFMQAIKKGMGLTFLPPNIV